MDVPIVVNSLHSRTVPRIVGVFLMVLVTTAGCGRKSHPEVSFYYWRTEYKLSADEKSVLLKNNVTKLYVRYFDVVVKDSAVIPVSAITFLEPPTLAVQPVVYVKNEVLMLRSVDIEELSKKITALIAAINKANKISSNGIQIDCDWTVRSKSNYMKLIENVKRRSGLNVTSTIRLHQIKYYHQTGVPAVDRGVLMYYNMGRIAADASNSIYDRSTARKYLQSLKNYPIALDVALPIFSWGVHSRASKVLGLINKIDVRGFRSDTNFSAAGDNLLIVRNNVITAGTFFKKGDVVKIESVATSDLTEMCDDLQENLSTSPREIIFFDLDDNNIREHGHEAAFQEYCNSF